MLKFIFGRACSGKTTALLGEIKADASRPDRKPVLIVPEQSTFEYERKLLKMLGDGGFTSVPVLCFTRLFDEVGRFAGGISGKRLDESGKLVIMRRTLISIESRLEFFARYARDVRFCEKLLATVGELKRCGIDTSSLRTAADAVSGALSKKLYDVALAADAYDSLLSGSFCDPSDDAERLWRMLGEYSYFSEKTVYFDGFESFTGAQLKIIERIIRQADNVVFSFDYDPSLSGDGEIFRNVGATVEKISETAGRYDVEIEKPVFTDKTALPDDLAALERVLSGKKREVYPDECENITVCAADGVYDEAEFAAREMRRLVRTEGYRFRDFTIISRSEEVYRRALELACKRYEVPLFSDGRSPIDGMPAPVFLLSAMRAADSLTTENMLSLLKTGLLGFTDNEVDRLENYVFIWNIDKAGWLSDWKLSPSGLDKFTDKDKEELERLNSIRRRAVDTVTLFAKEYRGSARDQAAAVFALCERCRLPQRLSRFASALPPLEKELCRLSYDAVIDILDNLAETIGDSACTPAEFTDYFASAVAFTDVGAIPQTLDEAVYGTADRIKPDSPKTVFVLGLNQDVFPAPAADNGLIGGAERRRLLDMGLPLTDYQAAFSTDEEFMLYSAVCRATKRVYLVYSLSDKKGDNTAPSQAVNDVLDMFPRCKKINFGAATPPIERIETAASAYSALVCDKEGSTAAAVEEILRGVRPFGERIDALSRIRSGADTSLSPETAEKLFGKDMALSASAVENFYKCPFSYFCRYGLKAKSLTPAEIDVMHRGTIIHAVFERLISTHGEGFALLSDAQIKKEVDEAVEDYLSGIQGVEQLKTGRFLYLIGTIKKLSTEAACHMRDEFAQTEFKPVGCEIKIGRDGGLEPEPLKTAAGSIKIVGSIDRADAFGAYLRVVDYKTGKREFYLSDVLYGLNMQMLIYLYAALKSEPFAGMIPAGVLYLELSKKTGEKNFIMNGLLPDDPQTLSAMEPANEGNFIPKISKISQKKLIKTEDFPLIFSHVEKMLCNMNEALLSGKTPVAPTDGIYSDACKYCDYKSVCGIEKRPHREAKKRSHDEILAAIKEGEEDV